MPECVVCCENRALISCKVCDKKTCKICIKRYIEESEKEVATCMHCSTFLTKHTLVDMLGITYVKQVYSKLQKKIRISNHYNTISKYQPYAERTIEIEKTKKEILTLTELLYLEKNKLNLLQKSNEVIKKSYTKKCIIKDCSGFLNNEWICGICEVKICKECHEEIRSDDHECDEDTKKTIKLLNKDTRSCPTCNNGIYKIEGCDQLWCTICHTAFSWKTGIIETGRIHNPHYYNYLRENSPNGEIRREIGDDGGNCDMIITNTYSINTARIYKYATRILQENEYSKFDFMDDLCKIKKIKTISLTFTDLIRHYFHCLNIQQNNNTIMQSLTDKLKNESVNFLLKNIKKNELDIQISNILKKNEILNEKNLVMDTVNTVMKERIYAYYNNYIIRLYNTIFFNPNTKKYNNINKAIYEDISVFYEETYNDFVIMSNEIMKVINFCVEQDRNIQRVYSTKTALDIYPKEKIEF